MRPGHLNPTVEEEVDIDLKEIFVGVHGGEATDDDTLVWGEYYKDIEVTDSEDGGNDEELDGNGGAMGKDGSECGVKRKRTIRVVIRSRAFL
jgi:hypothetical protein